MPRAFPICILTLGCYIVIPELQKGKGLINTLKDFITYWNRSAVRPSLVVPGDEPFGSMKIVTPAAFSLRFDYFLNFPSTQ